MNHATNSTLINPNELVAVNVASLLGSLADIDPVAASSIFTISVAPAHRGRARAAIDRRNTAMLRLPQPHLGIHLSSIGRTRLCQAPTLASHSPPPPFIPDPPPPKPSPYP